MARPIGVCEVCQRESDVVTACPFCGHEDPRDHHELSLPVGTLIQDRYRVGSPLGAGGFGITYRAWQGSLERTVAIKEYLPTKEAGRFSGIVKSHSPNHDANFRFGLESFKREARRLAKLSHENIVRVIDLLEEKGTAYLVMEYRNGEDLEQLLKQSNRLPEREAVEILLPILNALEYIHRKSLWHCDINPSNIYFLEDKTPLLLDFGAARSALGGRTKNTLMFTEGYAAYEQYYDNDKVGPWTDVHAVAATLYKMVTGVIPPSAIERKDNKDALKPPDELASEISPGFSRAILAGLALDKDHRPQSVEEFRQMLKLPEEPVESPASTVLALSEEPDKPPTTLPEAPAPSAATMQEFLEEPVEAPAASYEPSTGNGMELTREDPGGHVDFSTNSPEIPIATVSQASPWQWTWIAAGTVAALVLIFALWKPLMEWLFPERPTPSVSLPNPHKANPDPTAPVKPTPEEEQTPEEKPPGELAPTTPQLPDDPKPGQVHQNSLDGLMYVWIPPGEFQMGCTIGDKGCDDDEWSRDRKRRLIRHHVKIEKGFWIGQTEVTVAAYKRFADDQKRLKLPNAPLFDSTYWTDAEKADYPVVNAGWYDARDYCIWAGGRLTSEAEWEYSARGGRNDARFPWGNKEPICKRGVDNGANFYDKRSCSKSGTKPVRSYAQNGYGLYDMAGNVWEWCADVWQNSYEGAPNDGSARSQGREESPLRVFRGGAWSMNKANLRVSTRSSVKVDYRNDNVGFRCVIPPKEPEKLDTP